MNSRIKDVMGLAIILALVIGAYAAVVYAKSMRPGQYREFAVSGEGKIVSVPDVAQFTFSVISEGGKDLAALQKENVSKTNKAIDYLKENGVDSKDIKTQTYNVEPRYQYSSCTSPSPYSGTSVCPPPSIVGYTITQVVSVKVRDFSKTGDVLSGVVNNGANQVSSLTFTVDDPTAIQNQAREEAIKEAREKAEAIAKAGGFKLGALQSIDESGTSYPYYYDKAMGMGGDVRSSVAMEAMAPAPTVEPGSQDVKVTVTLRYQIR